MLRRNPIQIQIALILFVWSAWFLLGGGTALFSNIVDNWPITLTMVFGSFIAGATAEGGGAVAFPVFTKALHIAPAEDSLRAGTNPAQFFVSTGTDQVFRTMIR
jgi:hypothetical protein